jgi:hypothetical protein
MSKRIYDTRFLVEYLYSKTLIFKEELMLKEETVKNTSLLWQCMSSTG